MTYNGKKVIRMVGRYFGRLKCGTVDLEYADHTRERILFAAKTKRGRVCFDFGAAKERTAHFPSIYNAPQNEIRRAAS